MNLAVILLCSSCVTIVLSQPTGQTDDFSGQTEPFSSQTEEFTDGTEEPETRSSSDEPWQPEDSTINPRFSERPSEKTHSPHSHHLSTDRPASHTSTDSNNADRNHNSYHNSHKHEETVNEQTYDNDESSLLDARVQLLKKTKINKVKNQVSETANGASNAAGGLPVVGGLTKGLGGGLPDIGGLAKGLGGALPIPLRRKKRGTKTVSKKTESNSNKSQSGLTGALSGATDLAGGALPAVGKVPDSVSGLTNGGLNGLPVVGDAASSLTNQQQVVDTVQEEVNDLLDVSLNGNSLIKLPLPA